MRFLLGSITCLALFLLCDQIGTYGSTVVVLVAGVLLTVTAVAIVAYLSWADR